MTTLAEWRRHAQRTLGLSRLPKWTVKRCKAAIKHHVEKRRELQERPPCVSG